MALPKKNRITGKKEINHIFKHGRTVRGSFLFIKLLDNQKEYPRYAFVVPSRFVPLAVDRNKIKRVLSEEVVRIPAPSKKHRDSVIYLFRKITRDELAKLAKDLKEIISKI